MPIIHKIVEGGEQYLGWALQRERALRKLAQDRDERKRKRQGEGQASVTIVEDEVTEGHRTAKYDLGDAEVEIRVVGDKSYVMVRGTTPRLRGFNWIAYPSKIAPAVFESAAHATTPVENRPVVEKIPFVAIPRVPVPPPPVIQYISPPLYANDQGPTPTLLPCTYFGAPTYTPKMGRRYSLEPGGPSGVYLDQSRGWGVESSRTTPIKDEFGNVLGYTTTTEWVPYTPTADDLASPYFRAQIAGVNRSDYLQYAAGAGGAMSPTHIADVTCDGGTAVFGEPTPFAPGTADYEAAYQYILARHAAAQAYEAAAAAWVVAISDASGQNAVIDTENNLRYQEWLSETDAPMVAKKDTECDAWDAPKRPGRKAFMETLFTRVLAEVEAGFTTKWLTKVVLSPNYMPIGPFEPAYFIRRISSSTSVDESESVRTEIVTYGVTGPSTSERTITGVKTETSSFGPAGGCFTLNGDEYQSPFTIYTFSNYWLGDPANDMRNIFPSSTSRGRGYLATGTTTQRTGNKFLFSELNEVGLAEAVAFDSSPRLPCVTGGLFLDMGFANGCQVSIIVLRYMMWDEGANARVPVVGYTDTTSSFVCQSGNCWESNFVSRTPAPRNAADGVWLESVVTMTKANGQWSAPTVTKYPGVFLCPIVVDNTPRENVYEQVTLGIPFAQFPDFVVVVRGMRQPYAPETDALATAFTDKFFKLDTTESSVPPAIDCTTVAQMRDRITLEAIKQSNL